MIDLSGKRAFVTGGGRGIGRATAVMLSRAGCRVAIGYRSRREDAEETVRAVEGGTGRHRAVAIGGDLGIRSRQNGWSVRRCRPSAASTC